MKTCESISAECTLWFRMFCMHDSIILKYDSKYLFRPKKTVSFHVSQ